MNVKRTDEIDGKEFEVGHKYRYWTVIKKNEEMSRSHWGWGGGSYYKNIRILEKNMVCTKKNWDLLILNFNPLQTVELLS